MYTCRAGRSCPKDRLNVSRKPVLYLGPAYQ